eukprot:GHRR01023560.1.p1 GENE.GHRR01023560.1~~GHRR01023560.1.p1  ORF type:complete len:113 (+),score=17.05 GHRR01023560.1:96-434(+)
MWWAWCGCARARSGVSTCLQPAAVAMARTSLRAAAKSNQSPSWKPFKMLSHLVCCATAAVGLHQARLCAHHGGGAHHNNRRHGAGGHIGIGRLRYAEDNITMLVAVAGSMFG